MPLIRTYADITEKLGGPTPAEVKLLAATLEGEPCVLGKTVPPESAMPDPEVHIRADLLRYLITGGCDAHRTADWGMFLSGAHITGLLDLDFAKARGVTGMLDCRIDTPIFAMQARFELLNLNRSSFLGLNAQAAQISGDIFLRGVTTNGETSLSGASIGGQLDCTGATLSTKEGKALKAQRLSVSDSVIFRQITCEAGIINLTAAHASDLVDDPASWPPARRLILDGFTYDRLEDANFPRLTDRLEWLAKGSIWNHEFYPQPYTQLAKVYRKMGKDAEARAVLFDMQKRRRAHVRENQRIAPNGDVDVALKSLWRDTLNLLRYLYDLILRWVVGYGLRPFRSLWILAGMTLLATWLAHAAWNEGSMAPNSDVILTSTEWTALSGTAENPAAVWSDRTGAGRDWQTFNRYAYTADLVIPIIDLGQTAAWAPSTNRGVWGQRLWRCGFLLSVAGWIVTALGAAAITGIIRRD